NHPVIDDSVSTVFLDLYLETLDRHRLYFLDQDIAQFEQYRYELDNDVMSGQLQPAFIIFNVFKERVNQRIEYVNRRLQQGFDFSKDEYYQLDRSETAWANSTEELNEIWRKKLKHEALNLKLAGKDWEGIRSTLKKRYSNIHRRIEQFKSEDVFQYFMNALSQTFDPHTNYLSPISSENFDIDMSLSLEGIGAQLTTEDDYTKVVRILPGGPAERSKQIWPNDKIVGVAQGKHGEMIDVIGMRLDDVVQMIRGKKGTVVRLEIIPAESTPGSPTKIIKLVRDKIILTEREARSKTIELKYEGRDYKIGIIIIPTFYSDLRAQQRGKKNYKSTTRDVRRLLKELKEAQIDGLVIDLRHNGGGSLQEAIELTGLFIEKGPVVQVHNSIGATKVEYDPDPSIIYDEPLAVLVDRFSASASEIFAAAIQDYDRGIILGGQTFGKGTVQNLVSLNRFIRVNNEKFGQLKVTIAKFYRVTGGTTQHRGVIPDISYPSLFDEMDVGESTQTFALPWDQIASANFNSTHNVSKYISTLRMKSKKRIVKNPEFRYLMEDIEQYKQRQERKYITLQEAKRKEEREKLEARRLARVNERRKAKGLEPLKKGDEIPRDEKTPDALLDEAAKVLTDLISLQNSTKTSQINIEEKP
ncbi:MAG: carboxy terminal-processing peptidase, partial [bacterium]